MSILNMNYWGWGSWIKFWLVDILVVWAWGWWGWYGSYPSTWWWGWGWGVVYCTNYFITNDSGNTITVAKGSAPRTNWCCSTAFWITAYWWWAWWYWSSWNCKWLDWASWWWGWYYSSYWCWGTGSQWNNWWHACYYWAPAWWWGWGAWETGCDAVGCKWWAWWAWKAYSISWTTVYYWAWWWWGWEQNCCWAWWTWWWWTWYCNICNANWYWAWWWGVTWCANWWCWCQGVVIIRYKTDWSCYINCATWWTKYTCGDYTIHRFTSNWTFCIVS